ncbi:septum formation family protein [Frankia sp. CiP3]|uniref:septum formation family protein n=1 Tax=Frankia sp. CiP3 TaxID=2880971 RepID=UPI001EF40D71|nr:septum formation family protein [Frankia sp. CiP3]
MSGGRGGSAGRRGSEGGGGSENGGPEEAPDDDPFAGLVLDADFIAGARTYEAPARTRAALARFGAKTDLGRSWSPHPRSGFRRAASSRRRRFVAAVTGLVLLLTAGYAVVRSGSWPSAHSSAARTGRTPTPTASPSPDVIALNRLSYARGRCYTWNQDITYPDVDEVPCAHPHLFEAIRRTSVASGYPAGSAYPADAQWPEITDRYCGQVARDFLGYPLDPYGRFDIGPLVPTRSGWEMGDRDLVCGLAAAHHDPNRFALFTGVVEGADQAWVYPAGTCLQLTATETKGQVPCAVPHQAEVTGGTTMPGAANSEPPSEAAFDELMGSRCEVAARRYLGRPFQETSTMRVGWLHLAAESWRAGTRTATCMIYFFDASGQPAAITGALSHAGGAVTASLRSPSPRPESTRQGPAAPV